MTTLLNNYSAWQHDFVVLEVSHSAVETSYPIERWSHQNVIRSMRPLYILIAICIEIKGLTRLSAADTGCDSLSKLHVCATSWKSFHLCPVRELYCNILGFF